MKKMILSHKEIGALKRFCSTIGIIFCYLILTPVTFAELPTAQELLDAHRETRKALQQTLQQKKEGLKAQLTSELLVLDQQSQRDGTFHLRLWTHSSIRRLDELGDNWLAILEDPYEYPDPLKKLFNATKESWNNVQSKATDTVLEKRKDSLEKMEKLQIRLVQADRIDEAVITRELRDKLEKSKADEQLLAKIKKLTPKDFQENLQKQQAKEFASPDTKGPIPPPDARFPFRADNPTFKAYLKGVKAESSGFFATPSAHIQIGNNPVFSGSRGLNMVAFHHGEIVLNDTFDTYAEQQECVRLSKAIGDLPYGTFVVIAVQDDTTRRFTGSTQSSLYRLGASKGILNLPYRSSYILIGMKGLKMGEAIELTSAADKVFYP